MVPRIKQRWGVSDWLGGVPTVRQFHVFSLSPAHLHFAQDLPGPSARSLHLASLDADKRPAGAGQESEPQSQRPRNKRGTSRVWPESDDPRRARDDRTYVYNSQQLKAEQDPVKGQRCGASKMAVGEGGHSCQV